MTEQPLDPELQARLRELSEARVRAQVQSAQQRAAQQRDNRQEFARRRRAGIRERHSLKIARQNLTNRHQDGDQA